MNHASRHLAATFVIAALTAAGNVAACDLASLPSNGSGAFMVSALLQLPGKDTVVKLVHALQQAPDAESATTSVLEQVRKEYPGYIVVNTLATKVGSETPCLNVRPRGRSLVS